MSADLEVRRPSVPSGSDMNAAAMYAERLAASGLLPAAYRRNPPNVLYAIEYGRMIGLAPMAAITGVHVIEGKPSASAALIGALVRRAGHKLRVRGDAKSATAQIIRADDPEYVFEATFTIDDAKAAKLTNKEVWQKYPAAMLKSRAITQVCRDACEEVLFGLHYTPEELGAEVDEDGEPVGTLTPQDAAEAVVRKEQRERRSAPVEDEWTLPPQVQPRPAAEPEEAQTVAPTVDEIVAAIEAAATAEQVRELYRDVVVAQKLGGMIVPGHVYGAEVSVLQAITTRGQQLADREQPQPEPPAAAPAPGRARPVLRLLHVMLHKKYGQLADEARHLVFSYHAGRPITSASELTDAEVQLVLDGLKDMPDRGPADPEPPLPNLRNAPPIAPSVAEALTSPSEEQLAARAHELAEDMARQEERYEPQRIESDLRDGIEAAESDMELDAVMATVDGRHESGEINADTHARLTAAAGHRRRTGGFSHRLLEQSTGVSL